MQFLHKATVSNPWQLHDPPSLNDLLSEAKPVKHLHRIRRHPDTGPDLCQSRSLLNDLHGIALLLQSNRQRQAADACPLNQNVVICGHLLWLTAVLVLQF